jgi:hypothetical protein
LLVFLDFNFGGAAKEKLYLFLKVIGRNNSPMDLANYFCDKRLDEENTLRPGAIQIPDEIASKYYNTSNIQEIQDSPLPYTHPLQKPPAAKLKSNLWIPHALPTLILIIYLDEKDKKSKNEGFQVHVT